MHYPLEEGRYGILMVRRDRALIIRRYARLLVVRMRCRCTTKPTKTTSTITYYYGRQNPSLRSLYYAHRDRRRGQGQRRKSLDASSREATEEATTRPPPPPRDGCDDRIRRARGDDGDDDDGILFVGAVAASVAVAAVRRRVAAFVAAGVRDVGGCDTRESEPDLRIRDGGRDDERSPSSDIHPRRREGSLVRGQGWLHPHR